MTGPRPLHDADRAVARALALIGRGTYVFGTGDIDSSGDDARDCFGFACCELFGIPRHRPGFNRGSWATVSDALNCNSAIEDADHAGELFERLSTPMPGALILYPTIHLPGHPTPWIGHVKLVVGVSRCTAWDRDRPDWSLLDTVECRGPNGARPGIVAGNGLGMVTHDGLWPKPEHRTAMIRVKS
ncbi:MAG: hypothetical protein ABR520_11310 [Mycobacteriales bacterium]|nr:hypothetical protein [Actinomycetota bacterium]